jgi:exonuclease 3'-5' domain-containing protein 1
MEFSKILPRLVDSKRAIADFVDNIEDIIIEYGDTFTLYLNLEMQNNKGYSNISILTILVHPKNLVYIMDVYSLQMDVFTTPGRQRWSFRDVLESERISKTFFDVRNAATVLYAHFEVQLQGVQDIQLMQNASRQWGKLKVLSQCIRRDSRLTTQQKNDWAKLHMMGPTTLDTTRGGTYEIHPTRPLSANTIKYCVNEVLHLPELHRIYLRRLDRSSKNMLPVDAEKRVLESQIMVDTHRRTDEVVRPGFRRYYLSDISWIVPLDLGSQLSALE